MDGMFDDLVPAKAGASSAAPAPSAPGMFDDLIPKTAPSEGVVDTALDTAKTAAGSAAGAVGDIVRGSGELARRAAVPIVRGANALGANLSEPVNPFSNGVIDPAGAIQRTGDALTASATPQFQRNTQDFSVLQPRTWTPTGAAGTAAQFVGGVAPLVAANAIPGVGEEVDAAKLATMAPDAAAAVIKGVTRRQLATNAALFGTQSGGGAVREESARVMAMPDADLAQVPAYQQRIAAGQTPQQARAAVADEAAQGGFLPATAIGALGGVALGGPLAHGVQEAAGRIIGGGLARKVAVGAGTDAALFGAQGVAQNAAQTAGANAATGETRDPLANAGETFAASALSGLPFGAFGGLRAHQIQAKADAGKATTTGTADTTPDATTTETKTAPRTPIDQARQATLDQLRANIDASTTVEGRRAAEQAYFAAQENAGVAPPPNADGTPPARMVMTADQLTALAQRNMATLDAVRTGDPDNGVAGRPLTGREQSAYNILREAANDPQRLAKAMRVDIAPDPGSLEGAIIPDVAAKADEDHAAQTAAGAEGKPVQTTDESGVFQSKAPHDAIVNAEPGSLSAAANLLPNEAPKVEPETVKPADLEESGKAQSQALPQPEAQAPARQTTPSQSESRSAEDQAAQESGRDSADQGARGTGSASQREQEEETAAEASSATPQSSQQSRTAAESARATSQPLEPTSPETAAAAGKQSPAPEPPQPATDEQAGTPAKSAETTPAGQSGSAVEGASSKSAPAAADVQAAAHTAATSPKNDLAPPTPAQLEAGNFQMGHVKIGGLDVSIEHPAGAVRKEGFQPLAHHYGYLRGTVGADKDHVDAFLGPNAADTSKPVFVVDQQKKAGGFDEHKALIGFSTPEEARQAYLANYPKGWKAGDITQMTHEQFVAWVHDKNQTARPAAKPPVKTTEAHKAEAKQLGLPRLVTRQDAINVLRTHGKMDAKAAGEAFDAMPTNPMHPKAQLAADVLARARAESESRPAAKAVTTKESSDANVRQASAKPEPAQGGAHAAGKSELPAASGKAGEAAERSGEVTHGTGNAIHEVPLKDLALSKDVPQFKSGSNAQGVVEPLGGKFDRRGTGPIQVWRRNDGRLEVISGRHRVDLARRSGETTIPGQIYDEAKGFTAAHAATLDAELNIRDGQGKVKDYVQYFQHAPGLTRSEADARGLLARATGQRAYTLAHEGSPELLAAHQADKLSDEAAVQIAHTAPGDARLQALGMKTVMVDGRSITAAANLMRAVRAMVGDRVSNLDMFGHDDAAIREATRMGNVATAKQRELSERLAAISGATKRPELAKKEGIDVKNPKALEQRITQLKAEKQEWDNWHTHPELVHAIREQLGLKDLPEPARAEPEEPEREEDTATMPMFSKARDDATGDMFGGARAPGVKEKAPAVDNTGGDLFGGATTKDHVEAAARAKDEARNSGKNADTGPGGLFDGKRPEQAAFSKAIDPDVAAMKVHRDADGTPTAYERDGHTIPASKGLTPAEREVEGRAAAQVLADPDKALADYEAIPNTEGGRVISTDEAREIFPDYNSGPEGRTNYAFAVHEPASYVAKMEWTKRLAMPVADGKEARVVFTAGGTGAGKTTTINGYPELKELRDRADIIYDGNLQNIGSAESKFADAQATGRDVTVLYVNRDPVDAFTDGAIHRANKDSYGRTVPIEAHVGTHIGAARTLLELQAKHKDDPHVKTLVVNNPTKGREGALPSVESVAKMEHNVLAERVEKALARVRAEGGLVPRVERYYYPESGSKDRGGEPRAGGSPEGGRDVRTQRQDHRGAGEDRAGASGKRSTSQAEGAARNAVADSGSGSGKPDIGAERPTRLAGYPPGKLSMDDGQKLKAELTANWGKNAPTVHLVENADGFPASAKADPDYVRAKGLYEGKPAVYLNLDKIKDAQDFATVLAHEALGHYGVERVVGKQDWAGIVDAVERIDKSGKGDQTVRDAIAEVRKREGGKVDRVTLAKEAIAIMAERGVRNGLIDRVIANTRALLRKIMPSMKWTEGDIRQLLPRADSFLHDGKTNAEHLEEMQRYSFQKKNATFYSALAKSIDEAKGAPKSADAAGWKGWLDGAQRRGEFRGSERQWLGIDNWLDQQKDPVSRQEIADFVRQNQVDIKPVRLGKNDSAPTAAELHSSVIALYREAHPDANAEDIEDAKATATEWVNGDMNMYDAARSLGVSRDRLGQIKKSGNPDTTKFGSYVLPGGENYREHLLTLPSGDPLAAAKERGYKAVPATWDKTGESWQILDKRGVGVGSGLGDTPEKALADWARVRRPGTEQFHNPHFDTPNVLAHVRMNDRATADGAKALHIEEIQSDWHQQGRKAGYGTPHSFEIINDDGRVVGHAQTREAADALALQHSKPDAPAHVHEIEGVADSGWKTVPDAPLKQTQDWALLGFKHALREAVEQGKDKVTWTTGEQQAARYDLSKQVKSISWTDGGHGGRRVRIEQQGGLSDLSFNVNDKGVTSSGSGDLHDKRVEDIVGKEIGEKIMAADKGSLAGEGLKIGGAGMKAFYDKMLPDAVNKYVKQWGGKVGTSEIPTKFTKGADHYANMTRAEADAIYGKDVPAQNATVHSVDITPAMRASVEQGQPLFSRAPMTADEIARHNLPTTPAAEARKRPSDRDTALAQAKQTGLDVSHIKKAFDMSARGNVEGQRILQRVGRGIQDAALSKVERANGQAAAAFKNVQTYFDRMAPQGKLSVIDDWETGKDMRDAVAAPFFAQMTNEFNRLAAEIQRKTGRLEELVKNYFPHLYKDPAKAAQVYQEFIGKRQLGGATGFLQHRDFPTIKEAMAHGLELVSDNPADVALMHIQAMNKMLSLHDMLQEMHARGMTRFVQPGERVPPGFVHVDDKAFDVYRPVGEKDFAKAGNYVVPELVGRDISNYLSPGLSTIPGWHGFRWAQNMLLSARLGLSAFHAGMTTLDSFVSHMDVGARRLFGGDVAGGLQELVRGVTSPITGPSSGLKLLKQYYGEMATDPQTAAVLDALTEGGSRGRMDATEYNSDATKLLRAIRQGDWKTAALKLAPGAIEASTRLIAHHLVPAQKMTARVMLAKFALDNAARDLNATGLHNIAKGDYAATTAAMHPDTLREMMGRINADVDDRLGQFTYDNLHWNRIVRDVLHASVQSVGWNAGTLRLLFGGAKDIARIAKPEAMVAALNRSGTVDGKYARLTGRLSYLITLNATVALAGASLQKLLTDEWPTEGKDFFFPKTGRTSASGSAERVSFPSYVKDEWALATHPIATALHKLHPSFSMLAEILQNKDYYGEQVMDPNASIPEEGKQLLGYLARGLTPYAILGASKNTQAEEPAGQSHPIKDAALKAAPFIGVTPAPADIAHTKFENYVQDRYVDTLPQGARDADAVDKTKARNDAMRAMRAGTEPDLAGFTPQQVREMKKESGQDAFAYRFQKLTLVQKLRAWDLASPTERDRYKLAHAIGKNLAEHIKALPEDQQEGVRAHAQAVLDEAP